MGMRSLDRGIFFSGVVGKGIAKDGSGFARSEDREWGDLHGLLGNALLGPCSRHFKVPSFAEAPVLGIVAIGERDPGVTISMRASEPDSEIPRHDNPLRSLMIPVCRRSGGAPLAAFLEQ